MLSLANTSLSKIEKETPKLFMSKKNLFCTKEQKGKIMRMLVEESEGLDRQMIDGIKIFFSEFDWVLCIPDSEREIFHVNAEAKTHKKAEELVKEYSNKINKYQEEL